MLEKLEVPTRKQKDFINKYFNRDLPNLVPFPSKKRHNPHFSNVLCKFFVKGQCTRGEECIFSHDSTNFPCPHQLSYAICHRSNCPYKHNILEKNTDVLFDPSEDRKTFMSPF